MLVLLFVQTISVLCW